MGKSWSLMSILLPLPLLFQHLPTPSSMSSICWGPKTSFPFPSESPFIFKITITTTTTTTTTTTIVITLAVSQWRESFHAVRWAMPIRTSPPTTCFSDLWSVKTLSTSQNQSKYISLDLLRHQSKPFITVQKLSEYVSLNWFRHQSRPLNLALSNKVHFVY